MATLVTKRSSNHEDWHGPPLNRLSVLDLLKNFTLPQLLEKLQQDITAQTDRVHHFGGDIKTKKQSVQDRRAEEWRYRWRKPDLGKPLILSPIFYAVQRNPR
jgi:hypothetical protein